MASITWKESLILAVQMNVHPLTALLISVGWETNDVQGVMDGELTPFMSAYLRFKGQQATQKVLQQGE